MDIYRLLYLPTVRFLLLAASAAKGHHMASKCSSLVACHAGGYISMSTDRAAAQVSPLSRYKFRLPPWTRFILRTACTHALLQRARAMHMRPSGRTRWIHGVVEHSTAQDVECMWPRPFGRCDGRTRRACGKCPFSPTPAVSILWLY
jgi:hypothetical protein